MEKSQKFNFNLPSRDADDIADINQISDNFRIIDENIPSNEDLENIEIAVAEAIEENKLYTHNTFANAIKGTKSGSVISVNDVSPIEHDIKVTLSNEPTVNRFDIYGVGGDSVDVNHVDNTISVNSSDTVNLGKLTDICTGVKGGDTIKMSFESDNINSVLSLSLLTSNNSYTSLCSVYSLSGSMAFGEDSYVICTLPEDISNIYVQHEGREATLSDIFIGLESALEDFSSVEVTRYGKNLIKYPYNITNQTTKDGITFTDNGDGTVTLNGTATKTIYFEIVKPYTYLTKSNYFLSGCADSGDYGNYAIQIDCNGTAFYDFGNGVAIPKTADVSKCRFFIQVKSGVTVNNITFKPQLEIGTTATEYEPYKEPQTATANADGTVEGLTSVSPNMTLMTNAEGVLMDCTYNVDTKMYIDNELAKIKAELSAAIVNS